MKNRSQLKSSSEFSRHLKELQDDENGFKELAAILLEWTGIKLDPSPKNLSLMASRLTRVMQSFKLASYVDVAESLRSDNFDLAREFTQALTTNTTQFFREIQHFKILKSYMKWSDQKKMKKEWRLWCAASSRGQEVYSMAMTFLESMGFDRASSLRILGTDINTQVLEKSFAGEYLDDEVKDVPPNYLEKYFDCDDSKSKKTYTVKDILRLSARFAPFNLMEPRYPFKSKFDVIFCRNVLIYFDAKTALSVIEKMADLLKSDGLLFLGHSEAGYMKSKKLISVAPAVYRLSHSRDLQDWKWDDR